MRIGIVCPYDWSVPGGVKQHIQDLTESLLDLGHYVNVLTPTR
jgi:phosphatidylinositol alpha-mannosyltransferase